MYRTFKKFEREHFHNVPSNSKATQKDNIESGGNGYRFSDKEGNDVVFYSKISVIENLLEAYDALSLNVIERQVGITESIDYSKIDRYLDKAIYLDEDIIHIEYMDLPRNIIQYKAGHLIYLFCFILYELKRELEQEVDSRVYELASQFKEQFLSYDQSLFNEEQFEETIIILKDVLNHIDKATSYKDNDYWHLYEAIESFLYGELDMNNPHKDGVFWGISNFYQIWEDMCNTYIFTNNNYYNDIIYADTNITVKGEKISNRSFGCHKLFLQDDFESPFFIEFRGERRWMRPDLVHQVRFNDAYKIKTPENNKNYKNNRIDFYVELLRKSEKEKYVLFCKSLSRPGFRKEKIGKKRTLFKYYPEEKIQKYIERDRCLILLDWKYRKSRFFSKKSRELDTDITKQLCYESCIQQYKNYGMIRNQFVIPFFYNPEKSKEDRIGFNLEEKDLYHRLNESKIEVFKANFYTMQEAYLSND